MKRTGNCFGNVTQRILSDPLMLGQELIAVHGLPMGLGGDAKIVGRYPHAWLEMRHAPVCHDTVTGMTVERGAFYAAGDIKYTVTYTADEVQEMLLEHNTFGPWDKTILERDEEIMEEFGI